MIGGTWYVGDIYQVPLLCCRVIVKNLLILYCLICQNRVKLNIICHKIR